MHTYNRTLHEDVPRCRRFFQGSRGRGIVTLTPSTHPREYSVARERPTSCCFVLQSFTGGVSVMLQYSSLLPCITLEKRKFSVRPVVCIALSHMRRRHTGTVSNTMCMPESAEKCYKVDPDNNIFVPIFLYLSLTPWSLDFILSPLFPAALSLPHLNGQPTSVAFFFSSFQTTYQSPAPPPSTSVEIYKRMKMSRELSTCV